MRHVSLKSNWQVTSTVSDNGFAPNRRQAIISTNGGQIYWRTYSSLGLHDLIEIFWLGVEASFRN